MLAITRDVPSRPRFNLFTSRVCRTDYTILSLPPPPILSPFLSALRFLYLSHSLARFYENGSSYVKLR